MYARLYYNHDNSVTTGNLTFYAEEFQSYAQICICFPSIFFHAYSV